ncbi:peptidoglycan-binding protein [Streptomyces sp. NPDC002209]|uniref:peptidoglycan-binding domain-containing protein n=1 Tax=Streptomyces sp. NPDC002209 TaxID=3364638 RepID=UPI0036A5A2F1
MSSTITKKTRYRATALAAAALAFCAFATTTTSANAATAQGYVNGFDDYKDDWADEGLLSTTQHSYSGATGLWQLVLWKDGYLSEADVDCKFGPKTQAATKAWQTRFLGASQADGVVGPKTFGAASQRIHSTDNGWSITYGWKYIGRHVTTGKYFFDTAYTNGFVEADYNSAANCR